MHFCIQVVDVDADVLPDATATIVVSDVDTSPNHMNELSPVKKKIVPEWTVFYGLICGHRNQRTKRWIKKIFNNLFCFLLIKATNKI